MPAQLIYTEQCGGVHVYVHLQAFLATFYFVLLFAITNMYIQQILIA